ncbi:LON peptidase substrate-binding domain-containing protein [Pelagibacteraceae bacterium]|nr:LON peptidase substrate-binding domain-containing protein [Pelagibacteraceae bacterium]
MKDIFPNKIPVFPLSGVIYFPNTNLPLNIFEKRYVELVNDCMNKNKLMGMVQSYGNAEQLYNVGCLGKIEDFKETRDGRILVNLSGLSRFEIINEINNSKPYREFEVKYHKFRDDLSADNKNIFSDKQIPLLFKKTKIFFKKFGLFLNWKELEKLPPAQQVNTLAMISPISNEEKQKLLETITSNDKVKILSEIIEFYLHNNNSESNTVQ